MIRTLGAVCILNALALHRSEDPTILGRWSPTYLGILAAGALIILALVALGIRRRRRGSVGTMRGTMRTWDRALTDEEIAALAARGIDRRSVADTRPGLWLDIAILLGGLAYLVESVRDPADAARLLDLNLLGALHPLSILLGWLALVALFVTAAAFATRSILPRHPGPRLLALSLLFVLVLLEGCARAAAVFDPEIQGFPTYRHARWDFEHVRRDAHGFRDAEHALTPAPARRRLLVIGDSYAHGVGIENIGDRFGEQLGARLAEATGAEWEVITRAQPDRHTRDHRRFLDDGLAYRPDLVVLLYVFNDIDYLRRVTRRTVLTEHPDGVLARLHPARLAMANSFLAQEFFARWRHVRPAPTGPDPYGDSSIVAAHLADLRAFGERATGAGAEWAIVPMDVGVVILPALVQRYATFVASLRTAGLPVVSLAGVFDGGDFEALTVNRLDRHPSEMAYALAARRAAAELAPIARP